jgi:hypothetical protein
VFLSMIKDDLRLKFETARPRESPASLCFLRGSLQPQNGGRGYELVKNLRLHFSFPSLVWFSISQLYHPFYCWS